MLVGQSQFVTVFLNEFDDDEMICVWGFATDEIDLGGPTEALAHLAYDAFADHLKPILTNQYHLIRVEMEQAVEGGVQTAVWAEDTEMLVDNDAVPQNTAYLLHKRTNGVGTGKHGRCYIPGVAESKVNSGGRLDQDWVDEVNDSMTLLWQEFDFDNLPTLVVNRGLRVDPTDPPPRVPSVEPSPLWWYTTGLDVDPLVGTQRGRLRR